MDAIFIDRNGNKKNFLHQYDKGQMLVISDLNYEVSPEVHFATSSSKEAIIAKGSFVSKKLTVQVPDALLLEPNKITAYLYVENSSTSETVLTVDIYVRPRKKPSDYMYNDGMYIVSLKSVEDAITTYLDSTPEFIEDAIVDYTTVKLTDDTTGKKYMVGINNNKMYIKEVSA